MLTSVGEDFEFNHVFKNIQVRNKVASKTTVFENIYEGKNRTQYTYAQAKKLTKNDLPENWKNTQIAHFGAIVNEVDFSLLNAFPNALKGATIQGWLRQWDDTGKVSPKAMDWDRLSALDIIIMSMEDIIGFEEFVPKIADLVDILVMTNGADGAVAFHQKEEIRFPAFPIKEVDPTGAGDVFAVSFLVKFWQTKDLEEAMAFAHSAAAFVVEKVGVILPKQERIQNRVGQYKALYFNS